MEDQVPPNNKSDQAAAKKALQTERAQKSRERERKQCEFLRKCTLANVLLHTENPISLKGSTNTTALQSIKGVCPNLLGCNSLCRFVIVNKLTYWNKSKSKMCRMIVARKKKEDLDQIMYSEDFGGGAKYNDVQDSCDGEEEVIGGHANKKKKQLSKGAKPREIAKDGSLYRSIITYVLQELRPYVSQLGTNPLAVELGTACFLHEPIYNNSTHDSLKSFVLNHDIYVTSGVQKEAPATLFDELVSASAVSQGMELINNHYRKARR
jgi:hypothetical protein